MIIHDECYKFIDQYMDVTIRTVSVHLFAKY